MATRGVIARLTNVLPPKFAGRYHHWDSYPTELGQTLWQLYRNHFNRDLAAMLRVLLDDHPAGWSQINGADFSRLPGFQEWEKERDDSADEDAVQPRCYCHGDRSEESWLVTDENAAGSGCEWAYAFATSGDARHDVMLVLSSYRPQGDKMIGFFGCGDPQAVWATVAVVGLRDEEPDWERIESGEPLDPLTVSARTNTL